MFTPRFSLKEEGNIARMLSMYLCAHISLLESLRLLEESTDNKRKRKSFAVWSVYIEEGKSLTEAFNDPATLRVSEIIKTASRLGERSASLGHSLRNASDQIHKVVMIRKKIMSAITYPGLVLVGTGVLVLSLLLFVFPKIIPLFVSLKVPLPVSTRFLIWTTKTIQEQWIFILTALFVGGTSIHLLFKFSLWFQQWCNYFLLRIPVVGNIIQTRIMVDAFDSLHMLVEGGESLDVALLHVSEIISNYEYKGVFRDACHVVRDGKSLSQFLKGNHKLFPVIVPSLISVGERTGNFSDSIHDIANMLRADLDNRLRVVTQALEPLLMVTVSLVVGFIALSIILPMYGITSHFGNV